MKFTLSIVTLFVLSLFAIATSGQNENFPPPEEAPVIQVSRAINAITVDGKLDPAEWDAAIPVSNFFRREPRQGGEIRYETVVKFLYDDKFLLSFCLC